MAMNSLNRDGLEPQAAPKPPKRLARIQWFLIIMQFVTIAVICVSVVANQIGQRERQKRIAHLEEQLKQMEDQVKQAEERLQKQARPPARDGGKQ